MPVDDSGSFAAREGVTTTRGLDRPRREDYPFSGDARLPRTRDARDAERIVPACSRTPRRPVTEEAGYDIGHPDISAARRS